MPLKPALLFILVCSLLTTYAQPKPKANYPYLIYTPKNYKPNKKYPLVIYLHGGSQRGNDLNKLKVYGLPYLVNKGKNYPFIIASPQCPDDKYWSTENWLDSLLQNVGKQCNIDTNRIYLTGISIGGYGTYIVAMDYPNKFAAVVPLCGGINDSDTTRICNLKNMPIWAFHGTADNQVAIGETERVLAGVKACGGNMKLTRLPGKGHAIQNLYETRPVIYRWMLRQRKR